VYQCLLDDAKGYLNPDGYGLVEIFDDNDFAIHDVISDYAGIKRVVVGQRPIPNLDS